MFDIDKMNGTGKHFTKQIKFRSESKVNCFVEYTPYQNKSDYISLVSPPLE